MMKKILLLPALLLASLLSPALCRAQLVRYDQGAVFSHGITFLQDASDSSKYYYLPRFPRLAQRDDGLFEFLCLKYVKISEGKTENSGGLFHALIEFSLPDSMLSICAPDIDRVVPGAKIVGPVQLREFKKDSNSDDDLPSSFEIISSVLSSRNGKDALTRNLVTSGHAPFTSGTKAAIGAILNPDGATLLWNSFTGPTSDVSVAVYGYYEAMTRAYNAVVTADMQIIYRHFSTMSNVQKDYTKTQIRKVLDTMMKNGTIKVEVSDRSAGLGVKTSDMEGILSVITTKVSELMFDSKTGWSADPEVVDPNLGFNPAGRQGERKGGIAEAVGAVGDMVSDVISSLPVVGMFSRKRNTNPKYVTDNQYVLKDVTKIRTNKFYLNLSKSVSVKVPYHTAGNLNLLFDKLGNDTRYFRIVNMNDPDFQVRSIYFLPDAEFTDAFDDVINFVTVNFRKKYSNGQGDVTGQLTINGSDLKKDSKLKEIVYPRLGITGSDWMDYEYQVAWSFRGRSEPLRIPAGENQWLKNNYAAIVLSPPLTKEIIELDADRQEFTKAGVSSVSINFAGALAGDKKVIRSVVLRADDKSATSKIILYHDKGSPAVYQLTWYSKDNGKAVMEPKVLSTGYIFLQPPSADKFVK